MSMGFLSFLLPLLTTFLLISHFPIYCRARRAFYIIAYEAFQSDCAFDLGGYSFDLCPLAGTAAATTTKYGRGHLRKNEEINPTPVEGPSSGMRVYEVSLGLSSNPMCDSDTWLCISEIQGSESDPSRLISENKSRRNLKAVARKRRSRSRGKILASLVVKDAESIGPVSFLRLFLDRGEAEGRPQSAEIEMLCDLNLESYLEFINEYNGIHSFRWTTRHGCPTNILGRMDMQSSKSSTITEEASEETEQNDEDELRPPVGVSAARPWIAVILVIVVMSVLCSSLFLAYPRARHAAGETIQSLFHSLMPILSSAAVKLRPLRRFILAFVPQSLLCGIGKPFSEGSIELMGWAEVNMTIRETDVMINDGGDERYDEESWNGDGFEYIPLTANPKHGRGKDVKSYGATPDVETMKQKGPMGGIRRLFSK